MFYTLSTKKQDGQKLDYKNDCFSATNKDEAKNNMTKIIFFKKLTFFTYSAKNNKYFGHGYAAMLNKSHV